MGVSQQSYPHLKTTVLMIRKSAQTVAQSTGAPPRGLRWGVQDVKAVSAFVVFLWLQSIDGRSQGKSLDLTDFCMNFRS